MTARPGAQPMPNEAIRPSNPISPINPTRSKEPTVIIRPTRSNAALLEAEKLIYQYDTATLDLLVEILLAHRTLTRESVSAEELAEILQIDLDTAEGMPHTELIGGERRYNLPAVHAWLAVFNA